MGVVGSNVRPCDLMGEWCRDRVVMKSNLVKSRA